MSFHADMSRLLANQFVAVIFDNEVTVGEFVTDPPLRWLRLLQRTGDFEVGDGYPTALTSEQATFEMTNWDVVSSPAMIQMLTDLGGWADFVVFGNNAGQGVSLAQHLPPHLIADHAAIIYALGLPERDVYERLGYRTFYPRKEVASHLLGLARAAGQPLALCFMNTIQHNESNYHTP